MTAPTLKWDLALAAVASISLAATAWAASPNHDGRRHGNDNPATHGRAPQPSVAAPYAGQQNRAVSSLSAADVDDLLAGRGWGLAKPAELNGYPGPAHVLELADELAISPQQRARVEASFDAMQARAKEVGARYVSAERALDDAFREHRAQGELARRLAEAERLRAELRLVHLSAHLEVTPILTPEQRRRYAELRGYGDASGSHESRQHGPSRHEH